MPIISPAGPTVLFFDESSNNANVTIPTTPELYIICQAGGGASGERADIAGSGGGGGGFLIFRTNINEEDIGQTSNLNIQIYPTLSGNHGGNVIVTASLGGNSNIVLTAVGGRKGGTGADGEGGTAYSGNVVITDGSSGYGFVAAPIDERAPGFGGDAGAYKFFNIGEGIILSNEAEYVRLFMNPDETALTSPLGHLGRGADGTLPGFGQPGGPGWVQIIYNAL